MKTSVSDQINARTMELAKEFKPNMESFNNGLEFDELYYNGKTFCQVIFYDRHEGYTGYTTKLYMDLEKKEEFENAMALYDEKLEESQIVAVKEFGLTEYNSRGYYYNNRVGDNFGYCHIDIFVRSEKKEKQEQLEREKYYDDDYEVSCSACGDGGCVHCEPHRFI
jgi:hypothetical protein